MTDTANAPERIWTADTTGNCSVGFNTPSLDYKNEYISRTHCDELVAAEQAKLAAVIAAQESVIKTWPKVRLILQEYDNAFPYAEQEGDDEAICALELAIHALATDNALAVLITRDERMKAEGAKEEREKWQKPTRGTFDAMCAMRNSINEYIPMPSLESDLLHGPENSVFCAAVAESVINAQKRARAKIARLTEAANALVDFHNAPLECKRPDMFQRLISRLAAALRENANG